MPIHRLPPRSKSKTPVEDHYDDCGDDFTSLAMSDSDNDEKALTTAFSYDHSSAKLLQQHDDESHASLDATFNLHYLKGSDQDI